MKTKILAFATCLMFSVTAFAQTKAAQPAKADTAAAPSAAQQGMPPGPAPEFTEKTKGMLGNWKCTGKTNGGMGPAHPIAGTMQFKASLGGHWVNAIWREKKTKESPMPYDMDSHIGWDAAKKQLTRTDYDSMGGVTMTSTAGMVNNVEVWEGVSLMGPMKMGFRETVTQVSPKEIQSKIDFKGKDGKWATEVEMMCKK